MYDRSFRYGVCWRSILIMNDAIRDLFPALKTYTYLNSAAVSPIPTTAIKAVNDQLNDVAAHGSEHFNDWVATKNRARGLLANMMNVAADDVAFMRNTSDGFASVANGIDWQEGYNIVSFEKEFPSNYIPWRMVRDRWNVELRMVPERSGRIDTDEFIGFIDSKTRLVAISSIQYNSGFVADLKRIGLAARSVDALFAVDIIQGLGARAYDLPAALVDIACGASHKWLCAPEGCGFIYVSPRARDRVKPSFVGWISVETPWDFVDREQPFKPNALAWESGTGASSLFYGLEQSLKLLTETGLERIEEHIRDLSDYLCERLREKPYSIISSRRAGEDSGIVCVKHNGGMDSSVIAAELQNANIIVSPRGDRLRIATHFYNDRSDVDRLIEAMP